MLEKRRLTKLLNFWLLPFLTGGCLSAGYLLTHKALNISRGNHEINNKSVRLDKAFTEPIINVEKKIIKSYEQNNPKFKSYSIETNKTPTLKKNHSKVFKEGLNSTTNSIGVNVNKQTITQRDVPNNRPISMPKAKSNIDNGGFNKLFETLPKL